MSAFMCMAVAIWFEARGESDEGKRMVAETIMNRVEHIEYPKTVCHVVTSTNKDGTSCAFSWACDGKKDTPTIKNKQDKKEWDDTQRIAREVLNGINLIGTDALFFHSGSKKPKGWGKRILLGKVGSHTFYR